jgi:hypothetical protein
MDSQGKTFGLSQPHEYLDKLEWEFERMMKAGNATSRELSYCAMNVAMTAWHMIDWTFDSLPSATKAQFGQKSAFQGWVKKQSRVLSACRDVAMASKHLTVTKSPDPGVATIDEHYAESGTFEDDYVDIEWKISIDGNMYSLDEFGRDLISFWQKYLESQGLLPD